MIKELNYILFIALIFSCNHSPKISLNQIFEKQDLTDLANYIIKLKSEEHKVLSKDYWRYFKREISSDQFNSIEDLVKATYKTDGSFLTHKQVVTMEKKEMLLAKIKEEIFKSKEKFNEWFFEIDEIVQKGLKEKYKQNYDIIYGDCSTLKNGNFYYFLPDSTIWSVERNGNKQFERFNDEVQEIRTFI